MSDSVLPVLKEITLKIIYSDEDPKNLKYHGCDLAIQKDAPITEVTLSWFLLRAMHDLMIKMDTKTEEDIDDRTGIGYHG